ncbi:hypothetical protein BIW11_02583 [Tropilaelaps mercedesae]|uniref:Uncharacterized protein n=1 Tax=Tropilaelaps mercedesae TaxID=418985 RepID=A0A1V9Y0N7_9ACAR|nr:hypothetical protein BIW11_02583 [Tropilaelaps mercedesae]
MAASAPSTSKAAPSTSETAPSTQYTNNQMKTTRKECRLDVFQAVSEYDTWHRMISMALTQCPSGKQWYGIFV